MNGSNGKVPPNRKLYLQQSADGTWVPVCLASGSYVDAESHHDHVDVC
ncbi:hypothetical protein ACWC24_04195 [Streptomyces sp. NPDC001443]